MANSKNNSKKIVNEGEKFKFPFWQRLLALVIDIFVLALVGKGLAFFFDDVFAKMGFWGRTVGLVIAMVYFGLLNSELGQGQTIGKKRMGLRVVNKEGNYISLQKSFLRFTILVLPFFFNGVPIRGINFFAIGVSILIFCGGLGIVYFYLFNFKTRQTLHDIICSTYVVKKESENDFKIKSVAKKHFVIYSLLCLIIISGAVAMNYQLGDNKGLQKSFQIHKELKQIPKFNLVKVGLGEQGMKSATFNLETNKQQSKSQQTTYAYVKVNVKEKISDEKQKNKMIDFIAEKLINMHPQVLNKDVITVKVTRGYDIFLVSDFTGYEVSLSPAQWQERLKK